MDLLGGWIHKFNQLQRDYDPHAPTGYYMSPCGRPVALVSEMARAYDLQPEGIFTCWLGQLAPCYGVVHYLIIPTEAWCAVGPSEAQWSAAVGYTEARPAVVIFRLGTTTWHDLHLHARYPTLCCTGHCIVYEPAVQEAVRPPDATTCAGSLRSLSPRLSAS
jgi:hypothetical protein